MTTHAPIVASRATHQRVRDSANTSLEWIRQYAWLAIVIADAGLLLWGALTVIAPGCPGACMTNGYEMFTGQSWSDLVAASAPVSNFLVLLFRVFGAYNVAFGFLGIAVAATAFRRGERWSWWALLIANTLAYGSAMTYDRMVGFIGTNEMLEYVCLGAAYAAFAVTTPFRALESSRRVPATELPSTPCAWTSDQATDPPLARSSCH